MNTSDTTQANVRARIEQWKELLLDTSKRNALLYFKASGSKLQLVEPSLDKLWERIVLHAKTQTFYEMQPETQLFEDEDEEGDAAPPLRAPKTDEIRTGLSSTKLTRALYSLRSKANSSVEEQGVVTLFIAFGFLRWQEAANPNDDIFSPLILVPVTLVREAAHTPYRLKLWDEDPLINPALEVKLAAESKLSLPALADGMSIEEYFKDVRATIEKKKNWRIWEAAFLGLFSFHKIAMYNDLRAHAAQAARHPIVRALAGDGSHLPQPPENLPQGAALDLIAPADTWQVLDADSSQQEAIQAAYRGTSFVLEGPPGTGKSQTITNIIAECLARGKKILFVSEKMAALQVVYERLKQSGIGDFCLEAHSHKANKREVVYELGRTLQAQLGRNSQPPDSAGELAKLRTRLNDYVHALHQPRAASELSAYEVMGRLAHLQNAPNLEFGVSNAAARTPEDFAAIDALLATLERLHPILKTHETQPWRGVALREGGLQKTDEIRRHFQAIGPLLDELTTQSHALAAACGAASPNTLAEVARVLKLADLLSENTPRSPHAWLHKEDLNALEACLKNWQERDAALRLKRTNLHSLWHDSIFTLQHAALSARLQPIEAAWRDLTPDNSGPEACLLTERDSLPSRWGKVAQLFGNIENAVKPLSQILGVAAPITLAEVSQFASLAELVAKDPRPQNSWFDSQKSAAIAVLIQQAEDKFSQWRAIQMRRADYDLASLLLLNHAAMSERFAGLYAKATLTLEEMTRDLATLQALRRGAALDFDTAGSELRQAVAAQSEVQRAAAHEASQKRVSGKYFKNLDTDWEVIKKQIFAFLNQAQEQSEAIARLKQELSDYDLEKLLALNLTEMHQRFSGYNGLFLIFNTPFRADRTQLLAARQVPAKFDLTQAQADLQRAVDLQQSLAWFEAKKALLSRLLEARYEGIKTDWAKARQQIEAIVATAEENQKAYREATVPLSHYDLERLLQLPLEALLARFEGPYRAARRILAEDQNRDLKQLAAARSNQNVTKNEAAELLQDLTIAVEVRAWLGAHDSELRAACGSHFQEADTDWSALHASIMLCEQISRQHATFSGASPPVLQKLLCESGAPIAQIKTQHEHLQNLLLESSEAIAALESVASFAHLPIAQLRTWLEEACQQAADFLSAYDDIAACRHATAPPLNANGAVGAMRVASELLQNESVLEDELNENREILEVFFDGRETDFATALVALNWAQCVRAWFDGSPSEDFLRAMVTWSLDDFSSCHARTNKLIEAAQEEIAFWRSLFPQLVVGGTAPENAPLADLDDWASRRLAHLGTLDDWLAFVRLGERATELGLADFWKTLLRELPASGTLQGAFYRRFWLLWLDEIFARSADLGHFHGGAHETAIARFAELDTNLLIGAKARLRDELSRKKPTLGLNASGGGEVAVLLHEFNKKKRHKALRKLFEEIPNLLQALKPCMLMSPLSVAQFLHPERTRFDVVIFDEASQICSEDAVGAIMRGTQVIVVGDRYQLPPTQFFATGDADWDDESEDDSSANYESVLTECAALGLPQKRLLWHYRSRSEQLIAFSNRHFYEWSLVTFPGPFRPNAAGAARGLEFEHVNGTYIPGKGKEARTNPIEARRIAELVIEHFQQRPHLSLGVIAFNDAQATAIALQIDRLLNQHPNLQSHFSEDKHDAFFVKNLENVQGDERDVIFFSIGYGPDANGKISMNFGPLNRKGGERRLNVAVTRARHSIKIVSSLLPESIDLSRTAAKGAALLRSYLEYARHGQHLSAPDSEARSGAVEEAIALALEAHGLRVWRNVGYSQMRVDLAIENAEQPDEFLLGIECDGPDYAHAETARDRDRLRGEVLQRLGWNILHLWSPDWIKNPELQLRRILEKLAEIKADTSQIALQISTSPALISNLPTPAPRYDTTPLPLPTLAAGTLPNGVEFYDEVDIGYQGEAADFYYLADYALEDLAEFIVEIVRGEGPIHLAVVTRRLIGAWGMSRAGTRIVDIVENAAALAHHQGQLQIKGAFLWPAAMDAVLVRVPMLGETPRKIEEICSQEIDEAICLCVRDAIGYDFDGLVQATSRLLGYKQTGANVRNSIEDSIKRCLKNSRLKDLGGSISLNNG